MAERLGTRFIGEFYTGSNPVAATNMVPYTNGQVGGPSSRRSGFESPWDHQTLCEHHMLTQDCL